MSLSKLAEQCKKCPCVDTCDHKYMEAVGFLPGEPTMEQIMASPLVTSDATQKIASVRGPVVLAIGYGRVTITVDDLRERLYAQLGAPSNLLGGK